MKLSITALQLCAAKYGKGPLYGFETDTAVPAEEISKEEAGHIYDELTGSKLLDVSEESVHISALGHHILNMMVSPEQFIELDNSDHQLKMRLYFKDAYYLSVLEKKDRPGRLLVDLLPGLKEVVSAFVFAVYPENRSADQKTSGQKDIRVTGKSWNLKRELTNEIEINGDYVSDGISYRLTENSKGSDEQKCTVSDFVNSLTKWLFARLRETMAEREG